MEFQKKANSDFNIDKKFDDALQDECKAGKCVVATWLGPWMAPGNPFRVWLDVDEKVRAKRVAGREKLSIKEALSHIQKRDADNISRYKKVYGIDISDHDGFDLVIDANELSPKDLSGNNE
jgi:cytidylate kinase